METKKVIEQDFFLYLGDIEVSKDADGDIEILQWNKTKEEGCDIIIVEKSKAREVALAICPELGEPTVKSDNTKVIAYLEDRNAKLLDALKWSLEWIDAVPKELPLPVMPGFDRDYVDELIKQSETKSKDNE